MQVCLALVASAYIEQGSLLDGLGLLAVSERLGLLLRQVRHSGEATPALLGPTQDKQ